MDGNRIKRARLSGEEVINQEASDADHQDAGENHGQDDYEDDSITPPSPSIPQAPSKEEWIQHQITHLPYKSWCPICVKNAAINRPHKKVNNQRSCAHFSMDYMYKTEKPDEEDLMHPILVIKERMSGGV